MTIIQIVYNNVWNKNGTYHTSIIFMINIRKNYKIDLKIENKNKFDYVVEW